MLKKYRMWITLTCIVILLPILIGIMTWDSLPELMATNFGLSGEANGWSSRYFAVFGLPCVILALHFLCVISTRLDPRRKEIDSKMLLLVFWICLAVSWICAVVIYANALGIALNTPAVMEIFCGVLFIALGNYLPKCRQNYTVGVKLPWTLNDTENWNKTNRLAGWLFVLAGFLWITAVFTENVILPFAVMILVTLIPTGYSMVLYLRKRGLDE
ncbi:MAG: SdpI family protein [Lachnospiraceae bacterium]|nr:SdpI family protein [Lachnospiraceae bacterium]